MKFATTVFALIFFQILPSANSKVNMGPEYDPNLPPLPKSGHPLQVGVSVGLRSIMDIDEPKQRITVELVLRFNWTDHRIDVDNTTDQDQSQVLGYVLLTGRDELNDIFWFPDVFIQHARESRSPSVMVPPNYLRVYPGGTMYYAMVANYDLSCPMAFHDYPIDTQICTVALESLGMNSEILVMEHHQSEHPEDLNLNQHEAQFEFLAGSTEYITGSYPALKLNIILKRSLNYHLIRTYLPSLLFVTLAWMSMFIPIELLPARIGLSITTLLTLAAMFGALSTVTPPVAYTTKLDVWIIGCFIFVSSVLIETSLIVFVKYHFLSLVGFFKTPIKPRSSRAKSKEKEHTESVALANKLDIIASIGHMVCFLVFSFYWVDVWKKN